MVSHPRGEDSVGTGPPPPVFEHHLDAPGLVWVQAELLLLGGFFRLSLRCCSHWQGAGWESREGDGQAGHTISNDREISNRVISETQVSGAE